MSTIKKHWMIALAVAAVTMLTGYGVIKDLTSGTTACGTSATALAVTSGYNSIMIDNPNSVDVYLGGSNVTTTNGIAIGTGAGSQYYSSDVYQGQLYCIVASATTTVRHMVGK